MSNKKITPTRSLPRTGRLSQTFVVVEGQEQGLLSFLTSVAMTDKSRTTIKQLLHDRFISVDGEATTQWNFPLSVGAQVMLHPAPLPTSLNHKQVSILWQDDYLVMIHKDAGIPTVSSGQERDKTALEVVSEHLKKFNPRAKVFLLNRIDKDSAGFVLMSKTEELQEEITNNWDRYVVRQQFAVAIEGQISDEEGYLAPPTAEDGERTRRPSRRVQGGVTAGQARYRRLMQTETGALLVVELQTGRNNRLRRQFAALKRPILGDWRNGSPRKDIGRVALDAMAFAFVHPITGKRYDFDQPIPGEFRRWLKHPLDPAKAKPAKQRKAK